MRFIEHIIEPTKLLLAWQSSDENHRKRYIVAEITRVGDVISLSRKMGLRVTQPFLTQPRLMATYLTLLCVVCHQDLEVTL